MNLHIPGDLSIEGEASRSVALVLDSPHSCTDYPADFEHQVDPAHIDGHLASVKFFGMIREDAGAQPEAFKEVWNMSQNKTNHSGWLVAGIQAI